MASWNAVVWTSEMDAAIRRVYEAHERGGNKRLAALWGINPTLISGRAARLGLPPILCIVNEKSNNGWRKSEIELVKAHLGEPIAQIRARLYRKGWARSLSSIAGLIKRKRIRGEWPSRIVQIEDQDSLTIYDLSVGLGVSEWTLHRWIKKGLLRAKRLGGDGLFSVRCADLCKFLKENTAHWDHTKADKWFLVDALTYVPDRTKSKTREIV